MVLLVLKYSEIKYCFANELTCTAARSWSLDFLTPCAKFVSFSSKILFAKRIPCYRFTMIDGYKYE